MQRSPWSIADLDRQQLAVGRLALRAELDRSEVRSAHARLVREIRTTVGVPFALGGCFVAGLALGRVVASQTRLALHRVDRLGSWSAFAARALQALALSRRPNDAP